MVARTSTAVERKGPSTIPSLSSRAQRSGVEGLSERSRGGDLALNVLTSLYPSLALVRPAEVALHNSDYGTDAAIRPNRPQAAAFRIGRPVGIADGCISWRGLSVAFETLIVENIPHECSCQP